MDNLSTDLPASDNEWQSRLAPERYQILRLKGTEPAFSGDLLNNHESGVFQCAGCGAALFSSQDKFDSGSGWPSFTQALDSGVITSQTDHSHAMIRTEIMCARCGGHLGHVFNDGPQPTGMRYCVNSLSLEFQESKNAPT